MKARRFLLAAAAVVFAISCFQDGGDDDSSPFMPSSSSSVPVVSNCEGLVGDTVTIGGQTWMKSNLNCDVSGSKCYGNDDGNCDTYGRLYDWAAAMTACPSGWHLPSNADWDKLYRFADGTSGTGSPYDSPTASKYLKATSGWNSYNGASGNGEDAYGFSALPGGFGRSDGLFYHVGDEGYWWSASDDVANYAYRWRMSSYYENAGGYSYAKDLLFSVRCVKD